MTLDTGIKNCMLNCTTDTNYPQVWENKTVIDSYQCKLCNLDSTHNMSNCITS